MLLDRSLITRTSLHDVGKLLRFSAARNWDRFRQYSDMCDPVSLVLLDNINAAWDNKRKIKLPKFESIKVVNNSLLHRWIVLDAIESASSVPQESAGAAAIAAARAWLIDPSERNRNAAAYDAARAIHAARATHAADTAAAYDAARAIHAAALAARAAHAAHAAARATHAAATAAAYDAARAIHAAAHAAANAAANAAIHAAAHAAANAAANAAAHAAATAAAYDAAKLRIQVLAAVQDYLPEPV